MITSKKISEKLSVPRQIVIEPKISLKERIIIRAVDTFVTTTIAFLIPLFGIKFLWETIVVGLFPIAVEQGFIIQEISWSMALILALCIGVLAGLLRK